MTIGVCCMRTQRRSSLERGVKPSTHLYSGFDMNRRDFLQTSVVAAGSLVLADNTSAATAAVSRKGSTPKAVMASNRPRLPNLEPAHWIWYPSARTLQNTFVLFRREVALIAKPRRATGWISADSRYRLELNGQRVQRSVKRRP